MAALAASIAETVAGMRRVIDDNDSSSEFEEPYMQPTNRGNKLKRTSQCLTGGLNGRQPGPKIYKKTINHGGYERDILRRNPRRYDLDGEELPSDEEDEEADARAAEVNPYAHIKLEDLLAPLTSAAKLTTHPSMSAPYHSSMLPDMTHQADDMTQRERKKLADAKRLIIKFRGDESWVPAGSLITGYDHDIFNTNPIYEMILGSTPFKDVRNGWQHDQLTMQDAQETLESDPNAVSRAEFEPQKAQPDQTEPDQSTLRSLSKVQKDPENQPNAPKAEPDEINQPVKAEGKESSTGDDQDASSKMPAAADGNTVEAVDADNDAPMEDNADEEEDEADSDQSPPRRITRAQANAEKTTASSRSASPVNNDPLPIHPLFLIPQTARTGADFGLPATEADEIRRMLAAYVQKQEEVCRGAEKLYDGFLEAERLRDTVFNWSKAEGHIGEMSDGEDWYDKDQWGLVEDLKKGHVEEEEEVAAPGKKTRGRRT